MFARATKPGVRLIVVDFFLTFALIWTAAFAVEFARSRAQAEGLPAIGRVVRSMAGGNRALMQPATPSVAGYARDRGDVPRLQTYLLLSVALAGLAALNLAFWRHLRRAYASPRRGTWRRG